VQGAVVEDTRPDGWVRVSLPAAPGDALVSWILSFGPDAVAGEPESLRGEIVRRLEAALR
jgi:predicted DNA-binding transcriptional regulator YafY